MMGGYSANQEAEFDEAPAIIEPTSYRGGSRGGRGGRGGGPEEISGHDAPMIEETEDMCPVPMEPIQMDEPDL